MYQTTLPLEEAVGHILRHNISDPRGHKALPKGRRLRPEDLPLLHSLGMREVHVAVFEPGDVHEDIAARRLSRAVCGPGVRASEPAASRVNLLAAADGVVEIDTGALRQINSIDGLTIATLHTHSFVRARKRLATIKIIPFAIPEAALAQAEAIAHASAAVVALRPVRPHAVGVILVGSAAARERIEGGVFPAIESRVAELGSAVRSTRFVPPDEQAIAAAIASLSGQADMLIIAGETSIMDRDDVTPRAIRLAGGRVEHYGAPVEPGNLLLLAYLPAERGDTPVLGAPGCVRSRDINIVDLLLPRLLAGEPIRSEDIVELGHGGLL